MDRCVCIHGHFYQPPRENPWLESIELQDSAYPYHDWNERITNECYAPNAHARILDEHRRIVRIVSNYEYTSFDFGPTLLAWLKEHAPEVYAAVLAADRASAARFGGHGSAIAQAYNHLIMPLANDRDLETQVVWGLRDFEARFGRKPEGMWLPETAVDTRSLEALARHGVAFTILAPHQADAVRPIGQEEWTVAGGLVDTTQPYLCRLPSGAEIVIFLYDGPASRAVAFEGLLRNGEEFARRLVSPFGDAPDPQLVHIATDGESYGHHHRNGEMALAYALHYLRREGIARLTNYGEFLALRPPTQEVRIVEDSSWSCAHGIERWRSDCGCHTGGRPGWHQRWRQPLRAALDWLRDALAEPFEREASRLLHDPWAARDAYIDVVVDRSEPSIRKFLEAHARDEHGPDDVIRTLKLMELQRHAMLMYTSCGWFFNDISGIETVQVLQYAGRALQLAEDVLGVSLEEAFLKRLEPAESNLPEKKNGRTVYDLHVRPARVDLLNVAAHQAVSTVFSESGERARVYSYEIQMDHHEVRRRGDSALSVGRARVTSIITRESDLVTFAVVYFGDHNLTGGIRHFSGAHEFETLRAEIIDAFERADLATVVRLLANFPEYSFSLGSLFAERQREIIDRLMRSNLHEAELAFRRIYEENSGIMRFLAELGLPIPRALLVAAEIVINRELRRAVAAESLDLPRAERLLFEALALRAQLDEQGLGYAVSRSLETLAADGLPLAGETERLAKLAGLAEFASRLPFPVNLWRVQNAFYRQLREVHPGYVQRAEMGDENARTWTELFAAAGEALSVAVP